jgi:hypothetical protein
MVHGQYRTANYGHNAIGQVTQVTMRRYQYRLLAAGRADAGRGCEPGDDGDVRVERNWRCPRPSQVPGNRRRRRTLRSIIATQISLSLKERIHGISDTA